MEPFVVRRRSVRWAWAALGWLLALAVAMLASVAVAITEAGGALALLWTLVMAPCAGVLLLGAAESALQLRAGDRVVELGADGIDLGGVGFVPWVDVHAVRVYSQAGLCFGFDIGRTSAAWRGLPPWRRLVARGNTLFSGPAFGWPVRQLDHSPDDILAALGRTPGAAGVRVVMQARLAAT
jgi:hypothetical protein